MKLIWTKRALRELDQIFAFVAKDSGSPAAALVDLVEKRSAGLVSHPEIGRAGRSDGTRELVLTGTPYILPYRVRDGRFVNAALVRGGYARTLTVPPNVRFAERFARLARQARRAGRGLWSACASA